MDERLRFGPPLEVRRLFENERAELLELLESLTLDQWSAGTVCPGWNVRDVAAHLLGDDLGRLSRTRDGFMSERPREGEDLPAFIDRINQEWVEAARRMSPQVLVAMLRWTGAQIAAMWNALPPDELGEPVSWAGPEPAPIWLDAARDLSEYWAHHQQIREAVGLAVDIDTDQAGNGV